MNLLDLARSALPAVPATGATPEQVAELRRLVNIVAAGWPADEQAEALAVALADPEVALMSFRALVADMQATPPLAIADDGMRSCRQCRNLTTRGQCLAAWRGEPFGAGIAIGRRYMPGDPERPQRCAAYAPGPDDGDRRTGAERWPWLMRNGT